MELELSDDCKSLHLYSEVDRSLRGSFYHSAPEDQWRWLAKAGISFTLSDLIFIRITGEILNEFGAGFFASDFTRNAPAYLAFRTESLRDSILGLPPSGKRYWIRDNILASMKQRTIRGKLP